jgi:hypothetical protein
MNNVSADHSRCSFRKSARKCQRDKGNASRSAQAAPNSLHPAVDGLHSIDFSADKPPPFLLTLKMKGVQTTSFFDSF